MLYVLPMFVVIMLLGEGVRRANSMILRSLFYLSPFLVVTGTVALTREWFSETSRVLSQIPKALQTRASVFF